MVIGHDNDCSPRLGNRDNLPKGLHRSQLDIHQRSLGQKLREKLLSSGQSQPAQPAFGRMPDGEKNWNLQGRQQPSQQPELTQQRIHSHLHEVHIPRTKPCRNSETGGGMRRRHHERSLERRSINFFHPLHAIYVYTEKLTPLPYRC